MWGCLHRPCVTYLRGTRIFLVPAGVPDERSLDWRFADEKELEDAALAVFTISSDEIRDPSAVSMTDPEMGPPTWVAPGPGKDREVQWFGGDDDDAPGWRAFLLEHDGRLTCPGAPPRLTREMAEADLRWCRFDEKGFPDFDPPLGWPGRQYGARIEDCGSDSIFGVDVPEEKADEWCRAIAQKIRERKALL